ncbi:hypothetical protein [Streptomyces sp. NPDC058297]|uniref:hypothetical protein n=1 Tax=Streptomyces sp. NPDC058297 TaxID=3346433 RepID=UPI0036F087C2
MAEQGSTHTPEPGPTAEDFDHIISFITARLEPLRRESYDTDMEPALVGLTDVIHTIHGSADSKRSAGSRASLELGHLNVIARGWRDHPD